LKGNLGNRSYYLSSQKLEYNCKVAIWKSAIVNVLCSFCDEEQHWEEGPYGGLCEY
jgi:hypothetical protein